MGRLGRCPQVGSCWGASCAAITKLLSWVKPSGTPRLIPSPPDPSPAFQLLGASPLKPPPASAGRQQPRQRRARGKGQEMRILNRALRQAGGGQARVSDLDRRCQGSRGQARKTPQARRGAARWFTRENPRLTARLSPHGPRTHGGGGPILPPPGPPHGSGPAASSSPAQRGPAALSSHHPTPRTGPRHSPPRLPRSRGLAAAPPPHLHAQQVLGQLRLHLPGHGGRRCPQAALDPRARVAP